MKARLLSVGLLSGLAACAVGPNYHRPALPPASGYGDLATAPPSALGGPGAASAVTLVQGQDIPAQWWRIFHCEALDSLVAQALRNSPTIEAARAALRSAREQVKAQKGAYYPTVSASFQPSHQAFAHTLSSPTESGSEVYDLNTTQLTVGYTPDLFGANKRAVENLVALADQQRFELEAARLTLASNVVVAAVQDALLRAQIRETHLIIDDQRQSLDSFRRQASLGQASSADVAAQEALLAQAQATLPPLEKQYRVNRDLLEALVGRTPAEPLSVRFELKDLALPTDLPLSLPSRLVEQRPDVRIAEEQLHAAGALVGVAIAARLPNVEIDAVAGGAALSLAPEFTSASDFWSLTGTLTQPIFEGGMLLHRQKAAEAAYDQAAAQYRVAVVSAFQNTADTLHALWTDADGERAAEASETASKTSLEIARRELALGDISPLAVLGAEQTDAQARMTLLQARANRYADAAALFQALGGGWWNAQPGSAATR